MSKLGTSQNGWPVYDDTSHFTRVTIEGVGFWAANADVAVVLASFTQRYNDEIESITLPVKESPGYDDWSYAVRPVRGQTSGYSNHASATAWDLNSTRHPRGVHGTYSDLKRRGLRSLVDDYDGVLRDGEFYNQGTIDGMHVEINASASAVKRVADEIRERDMFTSADKEWIRNEIAKAKGISVEDILGARVKLNTQSQVNAMNSNVDPAGTQFKLGDTVSVERLLLWGGPGAEREYKLMRDVFGIVTPDPETKAK